MIRQPNWLKGESAEFWQRNAKRLWEDGMLTDKDVDGFCLLCEVWGLMKACDIERINDKGEKDSKEAIRYIALIKQCQSLMKQFGLLPRDRKTSNLDPEVGIDDFINKKLESR